MTTDTFGELMKKNLLYITELFPYPATSGATIKSLNTIQTLSKKFNITLICFSDSEISEKRKEKINSIVTDTKIFALPNLHQNPNSDLKLLIKYYLKLKPYLLFQFSSNEATNYINNYIATWKPDIIHIDHLNMTQYLPKHKMQIWIHEEHNIENQLAWKKFCNFKTWKKTKLFLFFEFILIKLYEKRMYQKFDHIFAISDYDTKLLKKCFSITNVSTQKLVYLDTPHSKKKKSEDSILFIGDLNWEPNKQAIIWFTEKVFPYIIKKYPTIKLKIVGNIENEFKEKISEPKNIVLYGFQKDISQFLDEATIFILPFHVGAGVRIKALTAAFNKIPIVSTKLGVQGIGLINKVHILETENPKKFALFCTVLLKKPFLRKRLSDAAYKLVAKKYSIKNNISFMKKYLEVTQ